ncbi:hypothetical protein EYF80_000830 [Liparis tanakae]|uniref:Uncharacterized protein n=1 Tax=Liparis tanakae TaxID=230148 RepID=A0A4Z2JI62_9TELE|nr:hypothetical protein EYF80_000830 [Liparis tanakae]
MLYSRSLDGNTHSLAGEVDKRTRGAPPTALLPRPTAGITQRSSFSCTLSLHLYPPQPAPPSCVTPAGRTMVGALTVLPENEEQDQTQQPNKLPSPSENQTFTRSCRKWHFPPGHGEVWPRLQTQLAVSLLAVAASQSPAPLPLLGSWEQWELWAAITGQNRAEVLSSTFRASRRLNMTAAGPAARGYQRHQRQQRLMLLVDVAGPGVGPAQRRVSQCRKWRVSPGDKLFLQNKEIIRKMTAGPANRKPRGPGLRELPPSIS